MNRIQISGFSDEISPSFDEQLKVLNEFGVKYTEIRGVDGKNISELSSEELESTARKLEKAHIAVSSIGSPMGKIKITDDFAPHFESFKKCCTTAKLLGTDYIRMFSFYMPETDKPELYREEVFSRLDRMLSFASKKGITLLHENEKGIYGDNAARCLDIMEKFSCNNFAAVFDFANFIQVGQKTKAAYEMLKPYIKYVHIKDAIGMEVVPAGLGQGHVKSILRDILNSGYKGFLSLEPHLTDFAGFSALENGEKSEKLMDNGKFAWWTALNALKGILYDLKTES